MGNVQFLQGTEEKFSALDNKSSETFYSTEDNLYLGDKKLTHNEFTGTTAEYEAAISEGKIKDGTIVNLTDDYSESNGSGKIDIIKVNGEELPINEEDKSVNIEVLTKVSELENDSGYVEDSRTIADIDLKNDITAEELKTTLGIDDKLDKTDDASNVTTKFTEASTREDLVSGEKLSESMGKIAKNLSDLNTLESTVAWLDKRAIVGQKSNNISKPWYKFASVTVDALSDERTITFKATSTYGYTYRYFGILTANINLAANRMLLLWEYASNNINLENFVLAYDKDKKTAELWVKTSAMAEGWIFEVLNENSRVEHRDAWTVYNQVSDGYADEPTPGYTQVTSTLMTLANPVGKLSTPHTIDGVEFSGSDNIGHFGVCNTSEEKVEKVVDCPGFKLVKSAKITVLFNRPLVAIGDVSPTLNVNNTGAKNIYWHNQLYKFNSLKNNTYNMITFIYDGDKYLIDGGIDTYLFGARMLVDSFAGDLKSDFIKKLIGFEPTTSDPMLSVIRSDLSNIDGAPIYSSGLSWSLGDTFGYLMPSYSEPSRAFIGGGNKGKLNWVKELAFKDDLDNYLSSEYWSTIGNPDYLAISSKSKGIGTAISIDGSVFSFYSYASLGFTTYLGNPSSKWSAVYSDTGTIQTSDVNAKKDIERLSIDKAKKLILAIEPTTYKMINGTSDRTHWGMLSNNLENEDGEIEILGIEGVINKLGWSDLDFAGFIKSPHYDIEEYEEEETYYEDEEYEDEDGEVKVRQVPKTRPVKKTREVLVEGKFDYALRYVEFLPGVIVIIQDHEVRLVKVEETVRKHEKEINALKKTVQEQSKQIAELQASKAEFESKISNLEQMVQQLLGA